MTTCAGFFTVNVKDLDALPTLPVAAAFTVMVVVPGPFTVTVPSDDTVATEVLLEVYDILAPLYLRDTFRLNGASFTWAVVFWFPIFMVCPVWLI